MVSDLADMHTGVVVPEETEQSTNQPADTRDKLGLLDISLLLLVSLALRLFAMRISTTQLSAGDVAD